MKRVELNAIYDRTGKSYDALRRTPQNPADPIYLTEVKENFKKGHQLS